MIARELREYYQHLDHHIKEVMHGTATALVLKVMGAVLSLGSNILLARFLGADGAGIYFLSLATIMIATVFGRIGLDNALLRFTASSVSVKDWVALKGAYRKGMLIALFASAITTMMVFALAPWLAETVFHKAELTPPLRWMALAVIPMALLNLHAEMLKGLKRILESQLVQSIGVPFLLALGLVLLGVNSHVKAVAIIYVLATVFTMLAGFWLWRAGTPQLREIEGKFQVGRLLSSSVPLFGVASMNIVMTRTPTFLLGVWGTSAEIGIFGMASRTVIVTSYILLAVNSIAAPKFAELYRQGDNEALAETVRNAAKLTVVLACPFLLLFIGAPGWIMQLFGTEFANGGLVLAILAVGEFINVITGLARYLLMMCGYERVVGINFVVVAVLNVVLCLVLIPWLGMVGAGIATAITVAINNVGLAYHVWRYLGICTMPFLRLGNSRVGA